jgi:uncharacterized protein YdeI (YjbR/CyaY-like superfamily)
MEITFFETPDDLRKWFEQNHDRVSELWVGYRNKASRLPSITYKESVDEALCFGWIDGLRQNVDETSYRIRFTPRKTNSNWSRVNAARAEELIASGRMHPSGIAAFQARKPRASAYSYEDARQLDEPYSGMMRSNEAASRFLEAQPPSYRRVVSWWVMSAKQEKTRLSRLQTLIDECANGRRMDFLRPASPRTSVTP